MEERNVGRSGLKVSALGLGCNNFGGRLDEAASARVVHAALDHGVSLFDTADIYPMGRGGLSEEYLGRTLGGRRDEAVIATKFGMRPTGGSRAGGGSRRFIVRAVEASLRRLGTDRLDLYQLHIPDPDTPIDETLAALDDLIRAGKILYAGCSNFTGWQIAEAHFIAREIGTQRFVSAQNQWSLTHRRSEAEVLPACRRFGLGFLPFFPLDGGLLTGKYRSGAPIPEGTRMSGDSPHARKFLTAERLATADRLRALAEAGGFGLIDLAFRFLLDEPACCSVIAGASTPEQIARNAQAAEAAVPAELLDRAREITAP